MYCGAKGLHRGELFRQQKLSLIETAKRLGCCHWEWLRAIVRASNPISLSCVRQAPTGEWLQPSFHYLGIDDLGDGSTGAELRGLR